MPRWNSNPLYAEQVVSRNIDRGDVKLLLETLSGMYKVGTPKYETAKVELLEKCEGEKLRGAKRQAGNAVFVVVIKLR